MGEVTRPSPAHMAPKTTCPPGAADVRRGCVGVHATCESVTRPTKHRTCPTVVVRCSRPQPPTSTARLTISTFHPTSPPRPPRRPRRPRRRRQHAPPPPPRTCTSQCATRSLSPRRVCAVSTSRASSPHSGSGPEPAAAASNGSSAADSADSTTPCARCARVCELCCADWVVCRSGKRAAASAGVMSRPRRSTSTSTSSMPEAVAAEVAAVADVAAGAATAATSQQSGEGARATVRPAWRAATSGGRPCSAAGPGGYRRWEAGAVSGVRSGAQGEQSTL